MMIGSEGIAWEIGLRLRRVSPFRAAASEPLGSTRSLREAPAKEQAHLGRLDRKRLLVIEDEPLVALDIIAGLKDAGVEVHGPVGNSKDALRIIEGTPLDGALLDANLHGRPVIDIAAALTRENVPFVFVTGYGRESLPKAFGNVDMLAKPFSREQLLEAAAQLVQKPATVVRLRD